MAPNTLERAERIEGEPAAAAADGIPTWAPRHVPGWVLHTTKSVVTPRALGYWRNKGYLSPPGTPVRVGSGNRFDWDTAIPQIFWLAVLQAGGKTVDAQDAAGGWALRAEGVTVAVRAGRNPWQPFDLAALPDDGPYLVAPVPQGDPPAATRDSRYPIGPLLAGTGLSAGRLARTVRASGHAVALAAQRGLTEWQAERWATRAGHHPGEVWPEWAAV